MTEFNQETITGEMLADFSKSFRSEPRYIIAQSAIANTELNKVALNRDRLTQINHTYSHKLDDWEVTNQQKSGRCWLFAGTNFLRY
ncbi:MAG: aminopeptidase, partial [Planctomycetes bacterium]|nr:aminopeptidase [Planctomycetota bacterium]